MIVVIIYKAFYSSQNILIPFNSLNTVLSGLSQMLTFADEGLKLRVA